MLVKNGKGEEHRESRGRLLRVASLPYVQDILSRMHMITLSRLPILRARQFQVIVARTQPPARIRDSATRTASSCSSNTQRW
eukprot:4770667-Pleurochrysis_carterae.AAC.1